MSDGIRDLTLQSASADRIAEVARAEGMRTLRQDAFEKVKQGVTAIDEVIRVLGTETRTSRFGTHLPTA